MEIPAKYSTTELSSVESAAVERIEKNLSQGLLDWDVGKSELQDIGNTLNGLTAQEKTNVIANLSGDKLQAWGRELDGARGGLGKAEQVELYNDLAGDLDAEQLSRVYDAFGEDHQAGLANAIKENASAETRVEFVEKVQRQAVEKIEVPEGLSEEEKELYLDLAQLSLDVVGIVEPTPFADGTNTIISAFRGDWLGAGLSLVGVIPYVGDLAKLGKLSKWADTVTNVITAASKSEKFASAVRPVLSQIEKGINSIPESVFKKLPKKAQYALDALSKKIDNFIIGTSLSCSKIHEILSIPKGKRPEPSAYLSGAQISKHLAKFESGAVRFADPKSIDKYQTAGPDGGFVMPKDDFEKLIAETGGDLKEIDRRLGLEGSLLNGNSIPVLIESKDFDNIRIPSGNEVGVNDSWIPGGYTMGGEVEAVMDFKGVDFTPIILE